MPALFVFSILGETPLATHGLVFMLGGIFVRWKQVVAYHYTPDGFDGACLKPIIEEIITKAESIGLYVYSVTSDMGGVNRGMWRAFSHISLLVNIQKYKTLSVIQLIMSENYTFLLMLHIL